MVAHNPRLDQDLIAVIKKFRDDEQVKCLLEIRKCYLPPLICAGAPGHGAGARGGERASLRLADRRHPLRLQKRDPGVGEDLRTVPVPVNSVWIYRRKILKFVIRMNK